MSHNVRTEELYRDKSETKKEFLVKRRAGIVFGLAAKRAIKPAAKESPLTIPDSLQVSTSAIGPKIQPN